LEVILFFMPYLKAVNILGSEDMDSCGIVDC